MKKILSLGMILVSLGLLVSCGPGKAKSEMGAQKIELNFPLEYKNDAPVVEGATYTVGMVLSSPFTGVFSPLHSEGTTDSNLIAFMNSNIYWHNEDFEVNDVEGGMATLHINSEKSQVEITFKEGLKWSDGHLLGADDFIYTLEVLGHKDYTGTSYNETEHNKIIGMKEYHEGKAKTISGVEKVSDTKVIIHLSEVSPKLISGGGAVLGTARILPKHYLSDVEMKDLATSDKVRKHPLSNGPYVLKNLVPGESVEYVPNEYYYLGKPNFEKVIVKTVTPQLVLESMKNGEFFEYIGVPSSIYDQFKDLSNFETIGNIALSYSYLGFNLGHYDKVNKVNVQDRKTPLQDVKVRQALSYALNIDEVASAFYHGTRMRATQQTPAAFNKYYDDTLNGYPYNPEKAKELLKEAGYVDTNNDGIVDKDGKNLKLNLAFMVGSAVAEPLANALIQYWREVGVEVELTTGRLMESNLFYDKIQANDDDIDMYVAGWSVGTSLDPAQTTSKTAEYNFSRFVDAKNDELLEAINNPKGLTDPNYRSEAYKAWQRNYMDLAVEIPLMNGYELMPINKAIKYANAYYDSARTNYLTEVTQKEPAKAE